MEIKCPICGLYVPRKIKICECGYNFETGEAKLDKDNAPSQKLEGGYNLAEGRYQRKEEISGKKIVKVILEFIVGIVGLLAIGLLATSLIGLGLQGKDLIFGETDYSGWLIMSVAEQPTTTLLLRLATSVAMFMVCALLIFFGIKIFDEK